MQLLKYLKLSIFGFAITYNAITHLSATASSSEKDYLSQKMNSLRQTQAFHHFEADRQLIAECLANVENAELHFFWTTGRTLLNNDFYGGITDVAVGGDTYHETFFMYVSKLLEIAPSHFSIKLVADSMTIDANKQQMDALIEKHGDRFEILHIDPIHQSILAHYQNPFDERYRQKINILFKNATWGNPAIASDLYRFIGMIYGRSIPFHVIQKSLYTYCDIDTFCFGIEEALQNGGHSNLIHALFAPLSYTYPFNYIGRKADSSNGNDIVKMRLHDEQSYKIFCDQFLLSIGDHPKGDSRLLTYFSELHDAIRACEDDYNTESAFQNYLKAFEETRIDVEKILYTTGPGFLNQLSYYIAPLEHTYPRIDSFSWHGTQMIKYGPNPITSIFLNNNRERNPYYQYGENDVVRTFKNYENHLFTALFAKRFGTHHPFNVKLREHIRITFPYTSPTFKRIIKDEFDFQKKNTWLRIHHKHIGHSRYIPALFQWNEENQSYEEITYENWFHEIFRRITTHTMDENTVVDETFPYYHRLKALLTKINIDISFTADDLDFREN